MDLNPKSSLNNASPTQKEIMRRVRVIYFLYSILNSPFTGAIGILVLVFAAGMIVSFNHVAANTLAYGDWGLRLSYAVSSFEHTRVSVQVIAVGIAILGSFILINSARTVRRSGFTSLFLLRRAG